MKQLFQNRETGNIEVAEVAEPVLEPGRILVRNVCSAVSPGTERGTVSAARQSYLSTARARPDLVKRVVDMAQREGVVSTYQKVQRKLSEPAVLGYSSAGVVEAVGEGAGDHFRVGDRVACAGQNVASHAGVVCVPVNLAARIPDGVSFEDACFSTLGAIALHGVRQAAPTLGERFAVIGLGIIGQLTVQILRANGVRVVAFDLDERLVERARAMGAEAGGTGKTEQQVSAALGWTDGFGVDGVIVTAATQDEGPMVAAADMCRDRARVVVVGFVPFSMPRETVYSKELELKIARSYGPGRYDMDFEEKGFAYPAGYVRWTETRNLECVLQLMREGRLRMGPLVSHHLPVEEAPSVYDDLVTGEGERPMGVVLRYRPDPEDAPAPAPQVRPLPEPEPGGKPAAEPVRGDLGVAFLGAGSFARSMLLPAFRKQERVALRHVITAHGLSAFDVRLKYGFEHAGTDMNTALDDPAVHLVCVATRHDLHADLVVRALEAGKHVFVEKPLVIRREDLPRVEKAARAHPGLLLVGFNRRFSPMAVAIREMVANRGPLFVNCRVNAGSLGPGHWMTDPDIGGGRMLGEGCHFIDLFSYLTGDVPLESVHAEVPGRPEGLSEDFAVTLKAADGSVCQIQYTARGNVSMGKERVEVFVGGVSAVIDDYRQATLYDGVLPRKVRKGAKGHAHEVQALVEAARAGGPSPISLDTLLGVMRATFGVHDALAAGRPVAL